MTWGFEFSFAAQKLKLEIPSLSFEIRFLTKKVTQNYDMEFRVRFRYSKTSSIESLFVYLRPPTPRKAMRSIRLGRETKIETRGLSFEFSSLPGKLNSKL